MRRTLKRLYERVNRNYPSDSYTTMFFILEGKEFKLRQGIYNKEMVNEAYRDKEQITLEEYYDALEQYKKIKHKKLMKSSMKKVEDADIIITAIHDDYNLYQIEDKILEVEGLYISDLDVVEEFNSSRKVALVDKDYELIHKNY